MPTSGKLIGAIAFALLAWFVSDLVKQLLPEGTAVGMLSPVNAFIGLLLGWRILGARAGEGMTATTGHAITTAVSVTFMCLLAWGGYEMYKRSIRMYYDGPVEALQEMALLMGEYAAVAATPQTIGTLLVGALFAGWVTEAFAARFG